MNQLPRADALRPKANGGAKQERKADTVKGDRHLPPREAECRAATRCDPNDRRANPLRSSDKFGEDCVYQGRGRSWILATQQIAVLDDIGRPVLPLLVSSTGLP